jgi:purine-nucleoside phosphorylase
MDGDEKADIAKTLVLVPGDAERQQYLDRGFMQNLVLREPDLSASILV